MNDDITWLKKKYKELGGRRVYQQGQVDYINELKGKYTRLLQEEEHTTELSNKAASIFSSMSQRLEAQFIDGVQDLVEKGLQSVFGSDVVFRIERGTYGKQPTMSFTLSTTGAPNQELLDAHGGGLVSLVGIILRAVVVRLLNGSQRQILWLDEPLSMLSSQYRAAAAELLRDLAKDLGLQIIMVSHHEIYSDYADTTIRLEKRNGEAVVGNS